jgi:hypothetical protein
MTFTKRTTPRNIRDAAAADVLRRAEDVIASAISADAARFKDGEKLIRQIVAVAYRKGLLLQTAAGAANAGALQAIWRAMTQDPELSAATTHLLGLVGANDVLILLDRWLPKPQ